MAYGRIPGGKRGIRTPGTRNCARQFSKLLVSATHPSFLGVLRPSLPGVLVKRGAKVRLYFCSCKKKANFFQQSFFFLKKAMPETLITARKRLVIAFVDNRIQFYELTIMPFAVINDFLYLVAYHIRLV